MRNYKPIVAAVFVAVSFASCGKKQDVKMPEFNDDLLRNVRLAASAVPGELPSSISYIKYAGTIRPWKEIVEDGSDDKTNMARTAFKINYRDGFIQVDAGMDRAVHHFFETNGAQPFDDTLASKVASSLQQAKLILITHEHGDHIAGVVRNGNGTVPAKTLLTTEQADNLVNDPQMPEIKLDPSNREKYMIADFESVLAVAPGVALIKAPGHTKGEIMIYTKLQNGKEYLFAGDVSWSFKGIEQNKPKPKSERKRVGEDENAIAKELSWLHDRLIKDKFVILVSHDDVMLPQYVAQGLLQGGF